MKAVTIVVMLLLGIGLLAAAVQMKNTPSAADKYLNSPGQVAARAADKAAEEAAKKEVPIPVVAAKGPYPKAVAMEREHDFGAMQLHSGGRHLFVIRNEGDAPLEIVAREVDTSCQCTAGTVSQSPVPPGGETTVELKWEIKSDMPNFRHTAKIRTNDPENQVIEMAIVGRVEQEYHLLPATMWDLGEVTDGQPAVGTGTIYSRIKDSFEIAKFLSDNPRVKCTWTPLPDKKLQSHQAKSGYELKVEVDMHDVSGTLVELVELQSPENNFSLARFEVKVKKPGPLDIRGPGWDGQLSTLYLGEFPAVDGKSATLSFFARVPEEVKLVKSESEHQAIQVTWTKDEKFQSKTSVRYVLKLDVLPGAPVNRRQGEAERVKLIFDHPQLGEMKLAVSYLSI